MKPLLLVLVYLSEEHRALVAEHFHMIYAPNENLGADRSNGAAQTHASETTSRTRSTKPWLAAWPASRARGSAR
ncbi:lactate dehydrogenase [Acidovorax sp. MR-S7]|nr:lactate dehydrogenase [Acidovorax sp. MR-S7]